MLAQNNQYISEASETIYQLTQEERIRLQCQAREDYFLRQRSAQDKMAELTATNVELTATNAELTTTNVELTATNAELTTTNAELTATIAALKAQMIALGIPVHVPDN